MVRLHARVTLNGHRVSLSGQCVEHTRWGCTQEGHWVALETHWVDIEWHWVTLSCHLSDIECTMRWAHTVRLHARVTLSCPWNTLRGHWLTLSGQCVEHTRWGCTQEWRWVALKTHWVDIEWHWVTLSCHLSVIDWTMRWAHTVRLRARVGLAKTIYKYGVYTVFLAGKSPNTWSFTVQIYGSGQPCTHY